MIFLLLQQIQANYEITESHYPFDDCVCDCTIASFPRKTTCFGCGTKRNYNNNCVGKVIAELMNEYFNSGNRRISPVYRRHLQK